ncbi:hypothetical protein NL676_035805 [Syzygium grande]|nr:hypothetical protein NL676_035805 [Syzygium grande]
MIQISLKFFCPCQIITGTISSNEGGRYLASAKRHFKYAEVINITNDFQTVIGKGRFGDVYLVIMNEGIRGAVKVLSASSSKGPKSSRPREKIADEKETGCAEGRRRGEGAGTRKSEKPEKDNPKERAGLAKTNHEALTMGKMVIAKLCLGSVLLKTRTKSGGGGWLLRKQMSLQQKHPPSPLFTEIGKCKRWGSKATTPNPGTHGELWCADDGTTV